MISMVLAKIFYSEVGIAAIVVDCGGYCAIKGTLVERHHRRGLLVPRKEMPRLRLRGTF